MKTTFQNLSQKTKDSLTSAFIGAAGITVQMAILLQAQMSEIVAQGALPLMITTACAIPAAGHYMTDKFNYKAFAVGMVTAVALAGSGLAFANRDDFSQDNHFEGVKVSRLIVV